MRFLLLLGFLLLPLYTFAVPDKIQELENKLKTASTPEERVEILYRLGDQYYYKDTDKALEYAQEALKLAQQHNYRHGIASAYNCLGVVYSITGNADKASTYHYRALRIREELKDSAGMSYSYNNLGLLLWDKKKYKAAIDLLNKSIQISTALHDTLNIDACHHNLGGIYLDQKMYDKALSHYQISIHLKEQLKDKQNLASSLNAMGAVYTRQEEWRKAKPYHERALKLARETKNTYEEAYSLDGLKQVYYLSGNLEQSLAYALECFAVVKKLNALNEMHLTARALSDIYYDLGNYKESREYLLLHTQYKDSLYNADVDAKIEELQLTYRNEKAEQENKLLKTERNLKNQQLERKNTVQLFIAALLLITLAAAFFFFKGKQRLHTVNSLLVENSKVLKQQKEELTQQAALLQEQKQELEKLHTVKDRLFSVIAHDLRGPLASLQDLLKLFAAGVIPESKFNTFLGKLEASQQNALWLLDNLLVWAKSQMQGFSLKKDKTNVYALAQENVNLLAPQAQHKGIELTNKIAPDTIALIDSETIKLVFRNLISNAIKFCSSGQSITLSAEEKGGILQITVVDTGTGIKPEHLENLFGNSSFTTAGTAKEKGSGLGLSLCKEFIKKNEGNIWVESEYGNGSIFYFTLPLPEAEVLNVTQCAGEETELLT